MLQFFFCWGLMVAKGATATGYFPYEAGEWCCELEENKAQKHAGKWDAKFTKRSGFRRNHNLRASLFRATDNERNDVFGYHILGY